MSEKSQINGKWVFGAGTLKAHYVRNGQTKSVCNRDLAKHDEPTSPKARVGYECKNCLAKLKGC
jgi:hypothetical protein